MSVWSLHVLCMRADTPRSFHTEVTPVFPLLYLLSLLAHSEIDAAVTNLSHH